MEEIGNTLISCLNSCQTVDALHLCIYDVVIKLEQSNNFDIGGTYSDTNPEFWFFCTTSPCYGHNFLLNLFVCHRKPGIFSIDISSSSNIRQKFQRPDAHAARVILPNTFDKFMFKSTKPEQNHYIKTLCFNRRMDLPHDSILLIPIKITVHPNFTIDPSILNTIKLRHLLLSEKEKPDFTLKSASNKEYPTHKILLAAHSPVLRSMIKQSQVNSLPIDISDNDMQLLLQFLYTATIKDLLNQDFSRLLEIADRFQLKSLSMLTEYLIRANINVNNAIELAVLAKKHQLGELMHRICNFILKNSKVLETEGWKQLKDVELTKYFLQCIYSMSEPGYTDQ